MKLVLLSGGSGTRLWPLSNKLKPKQFIEILPDSKGGYESMFQRVMGQIKECGLLEDTFIATTEQQVDLIRSQLVDNAPLILEPSSRDTFPAISLVAVYLYEKMGYSLEEVVCVTPVDVYAESSFFQKLHEAEKVLKRHSYDMALVGTKPSYAAEKYGYIVPSDFEGPILTVREFVEKPNKEIATKLIAQNALWNCGVFCFKLGFLIKLLESREIPLSYEKLVERYSLLPKISFDYEVVDKLKSVAVVLYRGEWDDLGTWDILTNKVAEPLIGRGYFCETSINTHIINELDIPILGLGLSNLVIVANEEGILIADKNHSMHLKNHIMNI
jgi:mannose-1-phosphate guanylyltransferase